MTTTTEQLAEALRRDAQLVPVLISYINDNLSTREKSRLVSELAARGLSDHEATRRAALARYEAETADDLTATTGADDDERSNGPRR